MGNQFRILFWKGAPHAHHLEPPLIIYHTGIHDISPPDLDPYTLAMIVKQGTHINLDNK